MPSSAASPRHRRGRFTRALAVWVLLAAICQASPAAAADPETVRQGLEDFQAGRFAEALQHWRQAAAGGDPAGALYVGVLYDSGIGVKQDDAAARVWYDKAAQAGSAAGAFNLGVIYDSGIGVGKNPARAAHWYMRAAALGSARGAYNLAMLYETGTGIPKNRARATAFYVQAARLGVTAARAHLAALGHRRDETPPPGTVQQGVAQQDRAMHDFEQAQNLLMSRGTSRAGDMAALFRRAAALHNPLAEYDLGYCYEHGMGVATDPAQAQSYYRRAAHDTTDAPLRDMALKGADGLTPPAAPVTP